MIIKIIDGHCWMENLIDGFICKLLHFGQFKKYFDLFSQAKKS